MSSTIEIEFDTVGNIRKIKATDSENSMPYLLNKTKEYLGELENNIKKNKKEEEF